MIFLVSHWSNVSWDLGGCLLNPQTPAADDFREGGTMLCDDAEDLFYFMSAWSFFVCLGPAGNPIFFWESFFPKSQN